MSGSAFMMTQAKRSAVFGFDGARARFLKFFPNGFRSDGFSSMERDYKVAAKRKLDENAPLHDALTGHGFGEAVLSVFRATNMLSPFEKTRIAELLRGRNADAFIQAAAKFAHDGTSLRCANLRGCLSPMNAPSGPLRPTCRSFGGPKCTCF